MDVPNTPSSEHSPEIKQRVWQAFSRAVADLHRRNILRSDIDDVNRVIYDPATDEAHFPGNPFGDVPLDRPATAAELAQNLVPLVQFIQASKVEQRSSGVWDLFAEVYLQAMDERGPEVLRVLVDMQAELRQAAEVNMQALSLAYLGQTTDAIAAFQNCLKMRAAAGDHEGYCRTLCNLALVYAEAGDAPKAFQTVDAAISWGRLHRRVKGTSLALFQKGLLLNRQGDYQSGLSFVEQAILAWERTGQPIPSQFTALAQSMRQGEDSRSGSGNGETGAHDG
jgi:tetratricopeptide (TPR) repeat protein